MILGLADFCLLIYLHPRSASVSGGVETPGFWFGFELIFQPNPNAWLMLFLRDRGTFSTVPQKNQFTLVLPHRLMDAG